MYFCLIFSDRSIYICVGDARNDEKKIFFVTEKCQSQEPTSSFNIVLREEDELVIVLLISRHPDQSELPSWAGQSLCSVFGSGGRRVLAISITFTSGNGVRGRPMSKLCRPACPDCQVNASSPLSASTLTDSIASSPLSNSIVMAPTSPLVRIAGLSGALAIGLHSYLNIQLESNFQAWEPMVLTALPLRRWPRTDWKPLRWQTGGWWS